MFGTGGFAAAVVGALAIGAAPADQRTVADVYQPGDEAHWVIEQAGQRIGETWSLYAGSADVGELHARLFHGAARISSKTPLGEVELQRTCDLMTDELGRPLHCVLRTSLGQGVTEVAVAFAGGKAKIHVESGTVQRDSEVAIGADDLLLANNVLAQIELIAALHPPAAGAPWKGAVFSPEPNVLRSVPFELRDDGAFEDTWDGRKVSGRKLRDSLGETLRLTDDGKLLELELPAAALKFRRVTEPIPKLELESPKRQTPDFEREEVVIENGTAKLAGTITKRKGSSGRRPAIFFVSGSGLQDRDGTSAGIDLGTHEILDRLTQEGYLVLRVDDRGAGASTGPIDNLSYDDLVSDARACVDFLMKRPDVDPARVAVIGHSEGAETAPILACERPLAAIVLMAGPGRDLRAIMHDQKLQALTDAKVPQAQIDAEMAVHKKFLDLVCGDAPIDPKQVRADYASLLPQRRWFQSHAHHDPLAQIRQVKCPVLIAQGAEDLQVSPELDAKALKAALDQARNPDARLEVFLGLDHLFKKTIGAKSSYSDYLKPRPVDAGFLDVLCRWLDERLKP